MPKNGFMKIFSATKIQTELRRLFGESDADKLYVKAENIWIQKD
ncbi:MAG: hypothetical protein OSJ67_05915 [Clostridia bacterium]|nr:hypothetical protein [Clostridia bacterium]